MPPARPLTVTPSTVRPPPVTLLAYALAGAFFLVERALRRGPEARSLSGGPADRGTTRLLGAAYAGALAAGVALPALGVGRLPDRRGVRVAGLGVMAAGLLLKAWAMRTLGGYYTRTLRVAPGQTVVRAGPYRVVRHPGYLASLLV
jgi:protein-S-isoprenylcysteine O-methyltransferase